MPKYIDAEKLFLSSFNFVDENGELLVYLSDVRKAIEQEPAADVIEVAKMSMEEQIKEMARTMWRTSIVRLIEDAEKLAELLYNAGWRKKSEKECKE